MNFVIKFTAEKKRICFKAAFYLQLAFLIFVAANLKGFFNIEKSISLMISVMVLSAILEISIQYFRGKELYFPTSAIIASLSCFLLIDSVNIWPYFLAVFLSIFSKFFIRFDGRHFFNPSNFGVVVTLILFLGNLHLAEEVFIGTIPALIFIIAFGSLISLLAGQILSNIFWFLNFFTIAYLRAGFDVSDFMSQIQVLTAASMLLFSFNMIANPTTTPQSLRGRFLYTLFVVMSYNIFDIFSIPYGNFYGVFIVSMLTPIFFSSSKKS